MALNRFQNRKAFFQSIFHLNQGGPFHEIHPVVRLALLVSLEEILGRHSVFPFESQKVPLEFFLLGPTVLPLVSEQFFQRPDHKLGGMPLPANFGQLLQLKGDVLGGFSNVHC
jgi:hypothetical protein